MIHIFHSLNPTHNRTTIQEDEFIVPFLRDPDTSDVGMCNVYMYTQQSLTKRIYREGVGLTPNASVHE